jgi:hypothetical protein
VSKKRIDRKAMTEMAVRLDSKDSWGDFLQFMKESLGKKEFEESLKYGGIARDYVIVTAVHLDLIIEDMKNAGDPRHIDIIDIKKRKSLLEEKRRKIWHDFFFETINE